jgi:hypothetical protein
MSREMAHKVIVPPKKNYVPKFLKQRDIGNFMYQSAVVYCCCVLLSVVGSSWVRFPDDAIQYLAFGEKYWDLIYD